MANFEYKIISSRDAKSQSGNIFATASRAEIEGWLNGLGSEGWEIINIDFDEDQGEQTFYGVLKRPK